MNSASILLLLALPLTAQTGAEFFESKVRPILVNHCYACHSAETKPAGGLRVDDRNGLLRGGDSGAAVVPGNPTQSLLLQRVQHENPRRRMPREGNALTHQQIADLTAWIQNGAAWPQQTVSVSASASSTMYERLRARHWAYQPLADPQPPTVNNAAWLRNEVDRFILAKLEGAKLQPAGDADRITLLRRVTFDLTGLPPSPQETAAFVADRSPEALENVVDRLLASAAYGERWGRHWLDVARYGESTGPSRNVPYPHAWRFRDYVIDAWNRDVPFDRFLREQIAGDLLPAATPQERDRLLIATGFLALGPKDVNQRFKERFVMDNVAEQIDTVTRSTLALTVGCARCHDHKFDPVPTADYYALAGIFTSTDDAAGVRNKMGGAGLDYYDPKMLVTLATYSPRADNEAVAKLQAEVARAKKEWEEIRGTPEGLALGPNGKPKQQPFRLKYEKLRAQLLELTDPATYGFAVHGARDAAKVGDTAIRLRGEAELLGPEVPRGFLTAFQVPGAPEVNRKQSGRLELAQWIAHPANPLTARVIVNRIWGHLFGQGLVSSVDNFGVTGDRPTHPELLDYLARRFIRDGWSAKKLIRHLVLSRTYRLGGEATEAHRTIDPANRLLWRHSPRRLDAEEIRDTIRATAGLLRQGADPAPVRELKMIEIRDNGLESRGIREKADANQVRSIYLPQLRGVTASALEPFDPVTQTLVTGQREITTVPTQALFLLNSAFVRRQSLALADRLLREPSPVEQLIERAYRLILGRAPRPAEVTRVREFVDQYEASYRATPAVSFLPAVAQTAARPSPTTAPPADPDNIDRTELPPAEENIVPASPRIAAWMSFVQSLYSSAEFRYIR